MANAQRTQMIADGVLGRAETFATVRAIASSTVLFSHAFVATIPGIDTPDYVHVLSFSLGHHAVHIFFLLSGFFLTMSLMAHRDPAGFLIGRILRLYPAVIVGALVAALLVGPVVTTLPLSVYFADPQVWLFIVRVGTLFDISATLPGAFEGNAYPGILFVILWTLRYELVFCAGLALAQKIGLLDNRRLIAVLLVGALVLHAWWFANGEDGVSYGSIHHFIRFAVAFGIGVAAALWR
ncbi:MAG: acyltransferase family protein, partial [Alphaproteobacteria bacterium]